MILHIWGLLDSMKSKVNAAIWRPWPGVHGWRKVHHAFYRPEVWFIDWFEFNWTSWQSCSPHSAFSTFQQPPQLLRLHKLVPLIKYKLRSRWKWFTRHHQSKVIIGNKDNTFIPHGFHEAASPTHIRHQQLPATNYLCSCFRKALNQFLIFINC